MGDSGCDVVGDVSHHGHFASVKRVTQADGKVFACKYLKFDTNIYGTRQNFRKRVESEIYLLNKVDHPNIVQYHKADWANDYTVMVYMEYVGGGNLSDYIEAKSSASRNSSDRPSEEQAWSFVYQLSAALAYCHHGLYRFLGARSSINLIAEGWTQILHRDIKPRNVLVRHTAAGYVQYKLCDFGLSVLRGPTDDASISYCGTRGYIAPEITRNHAEWTVKADIYSFGCTLYYFFDKQAPPNNQDSLDSALHTREPLLQVPQDIQLILDACLCSTPQGRPESKELFESASSHVNEAILALATIRESNIYSPIEDRASTFTENHHDDSSNHDEERVSVHVEQHDSNNLKRVGETLVAGAAGHGSNTSGSKPESQMTQSSFDFDFTDESSFSNHIAASDPLGTVDSNQTSTYVLHSRPEQSRTRARDQSQRRHTGELLSITAQPSTHVLSPDYMTIRRTRLTITQMARSSAERLVVKTSDDYPVFQVRNTTSSWGKIYPDTTRIPWLWSNTVMDMDGNHLFTLRRSSLLLWIYGIDAGKCRFLEIEYSSFGIRTICILSNSGRRRERLSMSTNWNNSKVDLSVLRTGETIARFRRLFDDDGRFRVCELSLKPNVNMIEVVAIYLVLYRLIEVRGGFQSTAT
ncbi:hypothetical protein PG993_004396 [Apiospora rasikravindrae]|uniref:non-specific serine/threonine protein kinase n=1 Tax=Apiospora rasikravindrae TaxID=990691 RepID=A0ABR1TCN8_9PEZI